MRKPEWRQVRHPRSVGLEIEWWGEEDGRPADIASRLSILNKVNGHDFGQMCVEPGDGAGECAAMHAPSIHEAVANVRALLRRTEENGITPNFFYRSPFPTSGMPVSRNPRHTAIWDAARAETLACGGTEEDWKKLFDMTRNAATQINYSFHQYPVTATNVPIPFLYTNGVLNLVAPRLGKILCRSRGLVNTGHAASWLGWASPLRLPQYGEWDATFEDFKTRFAAVPRFIQCLSGDKSDPNGEWAVDLRHPSRWGDPYDEGFFYKFSRLRCDQGKGEGRLEFRNLPSMCPDDAEQVAIAFDHFVQFVFNVFLRHGGIIRTLDELSESWIWREITSFPIAGRETIPVDYTPEMWMADVVN